MRGSRIIAVAAAAIVLAGLPGVAAEVDEIIAKHVQARGGQENWQAVETMRMTGSFTAFSKIAPFTLQRKRDDRYHLDTMMNDCSQMLVTADHKSKTPTKFSKRLVATSLGPAIRVIIRH